MIYTNIYQQERGDYMSYAHNKRKKERKRFQKLVCKTFGEFCERRNRVHPNLMTKEQYNYEHKLWENYKNFYEIKEES